MKLSESQKRHLRTLAHHLKPVVWVGQHGLKESVIAEIELALDSHELIKVKVVADRIQAMVDEGVARRESVF